MPAPKAEIRFVRAAGQSGADRGYRDPIGDPSIRRRDHYDPWSITPRYPRRPCPCPCPPKPEPRFIKPGPEWIHPRPDKHT